EFWRTSCHDSRTAQATAVPRGADMVANLRAAGRVWAERGNSSALAEPAGLDRSTSAPRTTPRFRLRPRSASLRLLRLWGEHLVTASAQDAWSRSLHSSSVAALPRSRSR